MSTDESFDPASPLSGRVALVTGVSRKAGIGFAVARRLLAMGASVFVQSWTPHDARQPWGVDPAGVAGVVGELESGGGMVRHAELDLGEPRAPEDLVTRAHGELGHVDILIANHARSGHGELEEVTAMEMDSFLHENVRSTILLVKEFARLHDDRRGGGRVVMMTSGQHLGPMTREVAYAVSKGAIHQATWTLSEHLIGRGVTVNAVNPGPTDTGWAIGVPGDEMPLGRWGTPEDAARVVTWLCTDDARWITGQVINSEGGFRR